MCLAAFNRRQNKWGKSVQICRTCFGLFRGGRQKDEREAPLVCYSCNWATSLVLSCICVYVAALEAEPETAHCCGGEKENKTHQWSSDMQSVFTGNERHQRFNGGVFCCWVIFLYKTYAGLCSTCNTHVPKNVTARMRREATAIGRLLCLSSNRIPFPWEGLDKPTNIHNSTCLHYKRLQAIDQSLPNLQNIPIEHTPVFITMSQWSQEWLIFSSRWCDVSLWQFVGY